MRSKRRQDSKKTGTLVSGKVGGSRRDVAHSRSFDAVAILAFLLLSITLFWRFVFSDGMLFGTDTLPTGYFFRDLSREFLMKYGELPIWDPYILSGIPFIDAMHSIIFYPTSILKYLIPLHRSIGYGFILHIFLAGVFMYYFLSTLKLGKMACWLGALSYMFAPTFVTFVYAGHDAKMFVIALLPLQFAFLEKGFQTQRLFYFSLLGGVVGLSILSSHVQMTYLALWGVGAYFLFRLFCLIKETKEKAALARVVGFFLLAMVVALALGAVQLVPPYIYAKQFSVRGTAQKTSFEHAVSWSLHPEEVVSLVVPEFGNWLDHYWGRNPFKLNSEYVGIVALFFAVLALVYQRNRRVWFLLAVVFLSIIYALGAHTFFFKAFYWIIPGVKLFRAPGMIAFYFSFAICVLGAIGCDFLLNSGLDRRGKARLAKGLGIVGLVWVGLGLLLSIGAHGFFSVWTKVLYSDITPEKAEAMRANIPHFVRGLWVVVGLMVVLGILVRYYMKGKIRPNALIGLVTVLILVDTWRIDRPFIQVVDPQRYIGKDQTIRTLEAVRRNQGPFRVFPLPGSYPANFLGIHRLESVDGFHDNEIKWYREFRGEGSVHFLRNLGENVHVNPFLNLLNVKYILYRPQGERAVQAIENKGALDRAFVVSKFEVLKGRDEILGRIEDPDFDYRNTVILEEDPGVQLVEGSTDRKAGWVRSLRYPGNEIHVEVSMLQAGFLVLGDNYFPYWRAFDNGRQTKIYKADYTLRAIFLDKGEHQVRFEYHSKPYKVGKWVSLITGIMLVAMVSSPLVRRSRGEKRHRERSRPFEKRKPNNDGGSRLS